MTVRYMRFMVLAVFVFVSVFLGCASNGTIEPKKPEPIVGTEITISKTVEPDTVGKDPIMLTNVVLSNLILEIQNNDGIY